MNNFYFFIFSTIEWTALLTLVCSVFSISIIYNKLRIFLSAFGFTTLAFIITKLELHDYNIFIQVPLVVLLFIWVFNEGIKYSIFISITGYIFYLTVQGVLTTICMMYQLVGPNDIQPFTFKGFMLQLATSMIVFLISYFIIKSRDGFVFNFSNAYKKKKNYKSTKPYIAVAITTFLTTAITFPAFFYKSGLTTLFLITTVICALSFSTLLFLSFKRSRDEIISFIN